MYQQKFINFSGDRNSLSIIFIQIILIVQVVIFAQASMVIAVKNIFYVCFVCIGFISVPCVKVCMAVTDGRLKTSKRFL